MIGSEENINNVMDYLDGVMSETQRNAFETQLHKNEELQKEVRLFREVNETISKQDALKLHAQLNTIYQKQNVKTKVFSLKHLSYIATGVAACLAFLLFGLQNKQFNTVADFYSPAEAYNTLRTVEFESDVVRAGMELYVVENYEGALNYFDEALKENENLLSIHLFAGISHFELQEYNEAMESFNTILQTSNNAFTQSAQWYKSLCLIEAARVDESKALLSLIAAEENNFYSVKAKKLLKKLK